MDKIIFVFILSFCVFAKCQINEHRCSRDEDCDTSKHFACLNNFCKCSVGYRLTSQQECISVLGSNCETDDECSNYPGATCETSKCTCPAGTLAGSKECNKVGQGDDSCTNHADCIQRFGKKDDNKECDIESKKCKCKAGLHLGDDKICKQTRMLNEECVQNDECHQVDSQNNNVLVCDDVENQGKRCKCKKGYKEDDTGCSGGAAIFILSSTFLIMIATAILKF